MPRRCLVLAALLLATSPACAARSDTQPTDVVAKEPTVTQIQFIIGGQALTATLDDTLAGRDFASVLPLELTLTDFASTEKVSALPRRLTTEGAPSSYAASAGDITYYAPWGNLAIFYRDFRSASGLVRLGAFDSSLAALLGDGPRRVRVEVVRARPQG